MGKHSTVIQVTNAPQIARQLNRFKKGAEKTLDMTVKDFKRFAPAWVSKAVRAEYNIKAAEIKSQRGSDKVAIGRIGTQGKKIGEVVLIYKGRVLTPTHFSMTPKTPKQAYTLGAKIKSSKKTMGKIKRLTKKQRKNVGRNLTRQGIRNSRRSPIMLMHTGNKQAGGTNYIPMQRRSQNRKDIKAIKTLSLPQMVSDQTVNKAIGEVVEEKIQERLRHHMNRYIK